MRNDQLKNNSALTIADHPVEGAGVLEWLDEACQRFKEQTALSSGDRSYSYSALNRMANRVANGLTANQLSKGSIVAVILDDRIEIIATLIGILRAGCVFVPLDPGFPEERLGKIVADLSPDCYIIQPKSEDLVTQIDRFNKKSSNIIHFGGTNHRFPNRESLADFSPERQFVSVEEDEMCYIYYTSGSTGTPKGIAGRLKGISHFIKWEIETFNIATGWRFSQFTQPTFDAFLRDVFVPLCVGGTVCIPPEKALMMGITQLIEWIDSQKINLIHCVPSVFGAIASTNLNPQKLQSLEYILMAGEILPISDVKKWRDVYGSRIKLVNLYGATETTMVKFYHLIQESDINRGFIPIGKPMKGARAVILDRQGNVCPQGVFGELYIRTPYQTIGYYNNIELTKKVFLNNPFSENPKDLIYKTGDLARVLNDGTFQLSGRQDNQVKIRGIRVELAEIENQLRNHPSVRNAVVEARDDVAGNQRLVAYLITDLAVERVPLRCSCLVESSGSSAIALTTEDISSSGVCLGGVPNVWKVGQRLRLTLQLPGVPDGLKLEGTISWRQQERAGILLQTSPGERAILGQVAKRVAKIEEGFAVRDLRRNEPRVPLQSQCRVEFLSGAIASVTTSNICRSGIRLVANAPNIWKVGQRLRLKLQLPGVSDELWLKGKVVWHSDKDAGIAFLTTPKQQSAIAQSVEYLIETQGLSLTHLRSFLKQKLPDYMMPNAFVMLDALPLTPNGKVDRRQLPAPDSNREDLEESFVAPTDTLELQLTQIWEKVLKVHPIGVKDNFFELGGHSLLAVLLFAEVEKIFGKNLPLATLFQAPTIEQLANIVRSQGWVAPWRSLAAIQTQGSKPPLFCMHAIGGNVLSYMPIASYLGKNQPVYGLQARGLDGIQPPHTKIPDMAADYIKEIRSVQPEGPYFLVGHSFGGTLAFEIAQQLTLAGQKIALLGFFDSHSPTFPSEIPPWQYQLSIHKWNLSRLAAKEKLIYIVERVWWKIEAIANKIIRKFYALTGRPDSDEIPEHLQLIETLNYEADKNYIPQVYPGKVTLFRAIERPTREYYDPFIGWGELAAGGVEIVEVPGHHKTLILEPRVQVLAKKLKVCLERAEAAQS